MPKPNRKTSAGLLAVLAAAAVLATVAIVLVSGLTRVDTASAGGLGPPGIQSPTGCLSSALALELGRFTPHHKLPLRLADLVLRDQERAQGHLVPEF